MSKRDLYNSSIHLETPFNQDTLAGIRILKSGTYEPDGKPFLEGEQYSVSFREYTLRIFEKFSNDKDLEAGILPLAKKKNQEVIDDLTRKIQHLQNIKSHLESCQMSIEIQMDKSQLKLFNL